MILKSFRVKIILWYAVALSLTLMLFGFFLYQDFKRRLNQNIEDILLTRADAVVDSIENFLEKEKIEAARNGVKVEDLEKVESEQFKLLSQNWVNQKAKDPLLFNIVVSIFDRTGQELASTRTLSRSFSLRPDILETVLRGNSHFDNLEVEITPRRTTPFRALIFPVMDNNRVTYLVRVMTSLSSLTYIPHEKEAEFRHLFFPFYHSTIG